MKVTSILSDNVDYFKELAPEGILEDRNLFCLGAIANDGTACSVLAVGIYEGAAYIEWIYTAEAYRRKQAARLLLKTLNTLLTKMNEKVILISFSDDCDHLEEFLNATGFFVDEDQENYLVPVIDLIYSENMDLLQEKHTPDDRMTTLQQLADPDAFHDYIHQKGISFLETEEASLLHSLIRMDESGKINGCMLISEQSDGNLVIPYLLSDADGDGLIGFFLGFKAMAIKHAWLEKNIIFTDSSGDMMNLLEKVLGEERTMYVVNGQKQGVRTI